MNEKDEEITCPYCIDGWVDADYFPGSVDYGQRTKHQLCNGTGKIKKSELERKGYYENS